MTHVELDEGQYVAELIYGSGKRSRSSAPEPALLPHLGAYLCHGETIAQVLQTAREFALHGGMSPPWMPLWEATLWGVAGRKDLDDFSDSLNTITTDHLQVLRILHDSGQDQAAILARDRINIGPDYPLAAGAARLAPLLSREQFDQLIKDPLVDPSNLDAESVRSILLAARVLSLDLPEGWIDSALNGQWFPIPRESRHAHVLPYLPSGRCAAIADNLATWVTDLFLPPDMRALWLSRVAPFVSSDYVWNNADLLDDLEPVWREHIECLLAAAWDSQPWADVFRAHPESEEFPKVTRPHETTLAAPADISSKWQAHEAMATLERSVDIDDTGAHPRGPDAVSPPTRGGPSGNRTSPPSDDASVDSTPPASTEPRRLQADVLLEESMNDVTAFVANKNHVIDVSIGRGGRIRAAAEIEGDLQLEFERTDKDWIVLPVWFHAPGHKQSGKLRVPRDQKRNSTSQSFTFTAPSDGRVLARIHIMRPGGGMLLQSAMLAGDVVDSETEAVAHEPDIELNVDVVAGNLHDPVADSAGQAVIADETQALTENDGVPVDIDVSKLQGYLVKLVHEIETAADRHGLDDSAVSKKLVTLAFAGQQLRIKFAPQLGKLAEANPLQIVSLASGDILPLELVYEGPPLSLSSKICPTWKNALRDGNCDNCSGGGPQNDESPARVCPMRFWSMQKVIERRTADTQNGQFHVGAERSTGRPRLRSIDAAVVAASGTVAATDVSGLRDHAVNALNVPTETAANWAEWIEVIRDNHPELLIAMPHNQAVAGGISSALMMGEPPDDSAPVPDDAALLAGSVTEAHVQQSGDAPGPIVLLLGCNTQFEEGRLSGFAGEFRKNGAALTVGTLGELRVDQAPQAARVIIDQIMQPPKDAKSMGDVLLSTRRRLLGEGMIMALLLVANGDAEWLLPTEGIPIDENT